MDNYLTIMCNARFIESKPELNKEINKLPFKYWHNAFIIILQDAPLSLGKEKAILKNKNPKITFGILSDHFMGLARKFGIPQVYIQRFSTERWLNRKDNVYAHLEEEKVKEYKRDLNERTVDLVTALCEKIKERKKKRLEGTKNY